MGQRLLWKNAHLAMFGKKEERGESLVKKNKSGHRPPAGLAVTCICTNATQERRNTDFCWEPAMGEVEVVEGTLGRSTLHPQDGPDVFQGHWGEYAHLLPASRSEIPLSGHSIHSILIFPRLGQTGVLSPSQDSVLTGSVQLDHMNKRPFHTWGPRTIFQSSPTPSSVKILSCNRANSG